MLEDEDTSVRSTLDLGSRTLSIMRQFLADVADVEKDSEKGTDASVSELNVKGSHQEKDTRNRHPTLNKDTIMALRKLIEEFEISCSAQMKGVKIQLVMKSKRKSLCRKRRSMLLLFFRMMKEMMKFLCPRNRNFICVMIGFSRWQQ